MYFSCLRFVAHLGMTVAYQGLLAALQNDIRWAIILRVMSYYGGTRPLHIYLPRCLCSKLTNHSTCKNNHIRILNISITNQNCDTIWEVLLYLKCSDSKMEIAHKYPSRYINCKLLVLVFFNTSWKLWHKHTTKGISISLAFSHFPWNWDGMCTISLLILNQEICSISERICP